ncbi:putative C6 transcription factor [Talaromyces proteolyticus]|uniref:C6 transcription factor n=1 Tax=Talaromyces proteolyticus TaxID=1131652 RepID=A0AAD4KH82_9EURO|nr:putative C6 transcription factor [Talaromyces proteolyticus]KAH8691676.1 putative C6 transcription factor [Talaromyces proteolyticus]
MSEKDSNVVFRPDKTPIRFFKACRWCRRQKMRCDARNQIPCFRCRSSGRDCIIDPVSSGSRRERSHKSTTPIRRYIENSPIQRAAAFQSPASTEQDFSLVTLRSQNSGQNEPESQQLSTNEMIAPVSAVHSMSVNLLGSENIFMENSTNGDQKGDIISRGIVSEELARVMYERFTGGSKNFLPLFDPIRDTFDSIRSRSLFCFTVIIYLASRAVSDLRGDTHMQRVLQDEAHRLAEDSFFERPTKLETVQGMILLAAYSEKTWFSIALILRTALDSGLEKSLDTLLYQDDIPRSSLSASMADRQLVWQTRTWLISFTLELDVASGTGRKSRIAEVDVAKLYRFLDCPLSLPADMRTVSIIELHQLRGQSRVVIDSTTTTSDIISKELPAIMGRLENWWTKWDQTHDQNGFHAGAFQRSSLKLMLHYARIFVFCISLARIQRLQPAYVNSDPEKMDQNVMKLWQSLITTIMEQLAFLINESSYRYQLTWAPTYPALTVAFVTTFALRIARWCPSLIDQSLLLERAEKICDFLKQPPYPDIHRTVSIFVNYARALIATQRRETEDHGNDIILSEQCDQLSPSNNGSDSVMVNAQPLPAREGMLEDTYYQGCSNTQPNKNSQSSSVVNGGISSTARPPNSRFPESMDAPNWTMSNSIADSFGLFEEGQNDIFDFLPTMPSIPQ